MEPTVATYGTNQSYDSVKPKQFKEILEKLQGKKGQISGARNAYNDLSIVSCKVVKHREHRSKMHSLYTDFLTDYESVKTKSSQHGKAEENLESTIEVLDIRHNSQVKALNISKDKVLSSRLSKRQPN